jgi:recombinational DNA repair protein (RecF pathway)
VSGYPGPCCVCGAADERFYYSMGTGSRCESCSKKEVASWYAKTEAEMSEPTQLTVRRVRPPTAAAIRETVEFLRRHWWEQPGELRDNISEVVDWLERKARK